MCPDEIYKCQFCDAVFNRNKTLLRHQRTAKKCLAVQQKEVVEVFKCEGCTRTFTVKHNLYRHYNYCDEYKRIQEINQMVERAEEKISEEYEVQLMDKDDEIQSLKELLKRKENKIEYLQKKLDDRPTITVNNHTTNNIVNISEEVFRNNIDLLTQEVWKGGAPCLAHYAVDCTPKGSIKCTDVSRRVLKYHNEKGVEVKDTDGLRLASKFFNAVSDVGADHTDSLIQQLKQEQSSFLFSDKEHCRKIEKQIEKLQKQKTDALAGANGYSNNLTKKFASNVASLTASKLPTTKE